MGREQQLLNEVSHTEAKREKPKYIQCIQEFHVEFFFFLIGLGGCVGGWWEGSEKKL